MIDPLLMKFLNFLESRIKLLIKIKLNIIKGIVLFVIKIMKMLPISFIKIFFKIKTLKNLSIN
jgi:hypothetical protein